MAKQQEVTDVAIAEIDRQIADLERAKAHIINAVAFVQQAVGVDVDAPAKPKRGRKKKGLPTAEGASSGDLRNLAAATKAGDDLKF